MQIRSKDKSECERGRESDDIDCFLLKTSFKFYNKIREENNFVTKLFYISILLTFISLLPR
jgi:hypothetical protein